MRGICVACLLCFGSTGSAHAEQWAAAMFDHLSHDFGVVARGAEVEHRFPLENLYLEDVHVDAVRSTCGCTTPKVPKPLLKTYEKGEIVAVLDTRNFTGRKDATLTVVFDKPFPAEVQLHVQSYIRSDVVIEPGHIEFGTVPLGTSVHEKASIVYAGRSNWKILRVEHSSPHLEVKVTEQGRGNGRVSYQLVARLLPTAPVGYIKQQINLITDDPDPYQARVPIMVEGAVVAAVTVRPSPLSFGVLAAGQSVTRQLVVHGEKPFSIVDVRCDDPQFGFVVPEGEKKLHLVPVTFSDDGVPGKLATKILIETDVDEGRAFEVPAFVQTIDPGGDSGQPANKGGKWQARSADKGDSAAAPAPGATPGTDADSGDPADSSPPSAQPERAALRELPAAPKGPAPQE